VRKKGGHAVAGLLMEKELRFLSEALEKPDRPFVAVLGGAKISGKIDVIQALLPRVDRLIVGGAMANTFFRALGLEVGLSLVEEDRVELAKETLEQAGSRILLPVDAIVAAKLEEGAETRIAPRDGVGPEERIGDIGPVSRRLFQEELRGARTIVWNGPMGMFEATPFREGTLGMAEAVAAATDRGALTVVGGGDSVAAIEMAGLADRITHVSTGGGASLELLAGEELPGVTALSDVGSAAA
jgi:phosphoglycerate kinase